MTGQGWTTGSDIRSRPTTKEYRDNYDRIFRKWDEYQEKCEKERKDLPDTYGVRPLYNDNGN